MRGLLLIGLFLFISIRVWGQVIFTEKSKVLGITHSYVSSLIKYGNGVTFYDFDNDGLDDVTFTSQQGDSLYFYKNTPLGFTRIYPAGIQNKSEAKQSLWVDFDNDGDMDLFVTSFKSSNKLYRNDGGFVFTDIADVSGITTDPLNTFGATWADYDNNGLLDLYITNYGFESESYAQQNYLYKNLGDGRFKDVSHDLGVGLDDQLGIFCASFLDYNKDGWTDFFIAQDRAVQWNQHGNFLFKNNEGNSFTNVSAPTGNDIKMNSMCVNVGDYDNNGWQDIYVTNTKPSGSVLMQNNGTGVFSDVALVSGSAYNRTGWSSQFFDFDNDMDLDLYVCGATPSAVGHLDALYENQGDGTFIELNSSVISLVDTAVAFSNAYGDYNGDGYPDIIVAQSEGDSSLFFENSGGSNHWLKIDLVGTSSNRKGIGAWIDVYVNGVHQVRYKQTANGFLAQNTAYEMIGLGVNTIIDSIHVRWPSGFEDKLYTVSADQLLIITEGQSGNLSPVISYSGSLNFCDGDSIELDAGVYGSYIWNTGETTRYITVKGTGNYTVSVSNTNGDYGLAPSVNVRVYDHMYRTSASICSGPGINDGAITIEYIGDTGKVSIQWSEPSLSGYSFSDLSGNIYEAYITHDLLGCKDTLSFDVSFPTVLDLKEIEKAITVYPNPARNYFTLSSQVTLDGVVTLNTSSGQIVYRDKNITEKTYKVNSSQFTQGVYTVIITTLSGGTIYKRLIIL